MQIAGGTINFPALAFRPQNLSHRARRVKVIARLILRGSGGAGTTFVLSGIKVFRAGLERAWFVIA